MAGKRIGKKSPEKRIGEKVTPAPEPMNVYAVRSRGGNVYQWRVLHEACADKVRPEMLARFGSALELLHALTEPRSLCQECGRRLDPAAAERLEAERDRKLKESRERMAERRKELALLGKL